MSSCIWFQSHWCYVPAPLNFVLVVACQLSSRVCCLVKPLNSQIVMVRSMISLSALSIKIFDTRDKGCEVLYTIKSACLVVKQDVDLLSASVLNTPLAVGMTLSKTFYRSHRPSDCCEPAGSAAAFAPQANLLVSIVRLCKKCCGCRQLDDDCRNKIRRSTRQTYFFRCSCNLHDLERSPSGWFMLCVCISHKSLAVGQFATPIEGEFAAGKTVQVSTRIPASGSVWIPTVHHDQASAN